MAVDVTDLGALEKALNDAAGKASMLWTTFVTFELYLAIAFGSVTHRDLLLEMPVKLPILNVDLPLVAFFVVAPAVFVIFHFYVFLQLYGLATKAREYDGLLKQQVRISADRQRVRQRLDTFLVLQFLAGPKEQRTRFQGFSLRLIAWITLVGAPVLILLQAQVTFLPYHREEITWAQRTLLLIDLTVIWLFWNSVQSQDAPILGRVLSPIWNFVGGALTLCVLIFSAFMATYPGEWADDHHRKVLNNVLGWQGLHDRLFAGAVDAVSGKPRSLFSNRLVLTDQSFVDNEKIDKVEVSRSFRGRDLRGAVLNSTDLRKADFTGAVLDKASLNYAKLQQARFGCALKEDARPEREGLFAESLLTPESYHCTSLQGASLNGAQLQGAWLRSAQLQGALLYAAQLQGALLESAQLQGATLRSAQLQGAWLDEAQLQGATLDEAQLQGATLRWAQLQGALLDRAQLQGASLDRAQLQGASLDRAQLQGASLDGAMVWRARGSVLLDLTTLDNLECTNEPWEKPWDPLAFQDWLNSLLSNIPDRVGKYSAQESLSLLDPSAPDPKGVIWGVGHCSWQQDANFQKRLTDNLVELACSAASAPYVARGLLRYGRIAATGVEIGTVADRLRKGRTDPTTCPGVKGFTDEDWAGLDKRTVDTTKLVQPTSPQ